MKLRLFVIFFAAILCIADAGTIINSYRFAVVSSGPFEITGGTSGQVWGNGTAGSPDPLHKYYYNNRAEFIILASELSAAGVTAGNITAIDLRCEEVPANGVELEIRISHTSSTTVTALSAASGSTIHYPQTVLSSGSFTAGAWKTLTFSSPFNWNGTSNLRIILISEVADFTAVGGAYCRTGFTNRLFGGYSDGGAYPYDGGLATIQQSVIPEIRFRK